MKILTPTFEIIDELDGIEILKKIEMIGRVAYKSEDMITDVSHLKFVKKILSNQHESVIEHFSFSVRFIVDRGVSHEAVRMRLASYTQESTRFCNYSKDRFGKEIGVICPIEISGNIEAFDVWFNAAIHCETAYFSLLGLGITPQIARSILPTALKTEFVTTANLREWRHILKIRTAKNAHPQMREVMIPLLKELQNKIPIIFDDIEV